MKRNIEIKIKTRAIDQMHISSCFFNYYLLRSIVNCKLIWINGWIIGWCVLSNKRLCVVKKKKYKHNSLSLFLYLYLVFSWNHCHFVHYNRSSLIFKFINIKLQLFFRQRMKILQDVKIDIINKLILWLVIHWLYLESLIRFIHCHINYN